MKERPRRLPAPTEPLSDNITSLLAFAEGQSDSTMALRSCPIIWHGYDSVAAVLRSLGTLPDQHVDNASKAAINAERRAIGKWLRDNWTERQWVDSVSLALPRRQLASLNIQEDHRDHDGGRGQRVAGSCLPLAGQRKAEGRRVPADQPTAACKRCWCSRPTRTTS